MLDKKSFEMRFFFFPMLAFSLPGLEVQEITSTPTAMTIPARSIAQTSVCPTCQRESHRVHSSYTRSPADLPVSGRAVCLKLQVRRFRCQNQQWQRQTFVESLPEVVPRYGRQTKRLTATLKRVAIALSGQAGERLLKHLESVRNLSGYEPSKEQIDEA
jgi:transposase